MPIIYEDNVYEGISYIETQMNEHIFHSCIFLNCDFSNASITCTQFNDYIFTNCNLSIADFSKTTLNNVKFKDCKILGFLFNNCHDFFFQVYFENCILDYSSFEQRKMAKTIFKNTSLKGVDFTNADLSSSSFINTDLSDAIFFHTKIQKADFTFAYNYRIDPIQNQIKKASFSKDGLIGLLFQHDIIIKH